MTSRSELEQIVIATAQRDPAFRAALLTNPKAAVKQTFGVDVPDSLKIEVLEEKPNTRYLILPVPTDPESVPPPPEKKQSAPPPANQTEIKSEDYLPEQPLFLDALSEYNPSYEAMSARFEKNRYVFVRGFLSDPLLSVAYRYLLMKLQTGQGDWSDRQVPDTMSIYGDALMETILELARPALEKITGKRLLPTYAYCRVYKQGDVLAKHKDRPACEISATLSLGHNVSEIRETEPDYVWPIFIDETPIACLPGDMVVYRGCEVVHWREAFKGKMQAQVFLHFVDRDGPYADACKFDGRPMLGLPDNTKATAQKPKELPAAVLQTMAQLKMKANL